MSIQITITLEPSDIIALIKQLPHLANQTTATAVVAPIIDHTLTDIIANDTPPAAVPPSTRPKPPLCRATDAAAPITISLATDHSTPSSNHIAPTPVAAPATEPTQPAVNHRNTQPRPQLPFDVFDKLVRSEIKRLSMDGRIPGYKLWESERDPRLPTLGAVTQRYGIGNLVDFANLMGLEAPLRAQLQYPNGATSTPNSAASPA